MKLSRLIALLTEIEKSVCYVAHESIAGGVEFILDSQFDSFPLEVSQVEIDHAMGCGCELGAIIRLKAENPKLQELLENFDENSD